MVTAALTICLPVCGYARVMNRSTAMTRTFAIASTLLAVVLASPSLRAQSALPPAQNTSAGRIAANAGL